MELHMKVSGFTIPSLEGVERYGQMAQLMKESSEMGVSMAVVLIAQEVVPSIRVHLLMIRCMAMANTSSQMDERTSGSGARAS
jgi:hypothetical protein